MVNIEELNVNRKHFEDTFKYYFHKIFEESGFEKQRFKHEKENKKRTAERRNNNGNAT